MKQTLDEQLSSLVDDELHGKERDFLIDQLKKDPAKQACWNRYHLIGDVMKEQVADYRLPDISQRVSLQLKNESVVIKPKQFFKKDFLRPMPGLAIAASVVILAMVGVNFIPGNMTTGVDSTLANFSNNGANKGDYDLEQLNSGNQSIVQFVSNTININRQVVPKGYQLSWYDQLSKNSQGTSEMMIISNGIKPVTVYVDKNNNQHINNVFSKQLNGFKITVVGEASNVTLRSIGDAIVVPDKAMNK